MIKTRLSSCSRRQEIYLRKAHSYYHLRIAANPVTVGHVLPFVAEVFGNQPGWGCDSASLPWTLTLTADDDVATRTSALAKKLSVIRAANKFEVLKGWRDELKDVYGSKGELIFSVERSAVPLLGVVGYGVYLTALARDSEGQLKIWIAHRSKTKSTYLGLLEVVISGGISAGEKPYDTVLRELMEEASLLGELLRSRAEAHYVYDYKLPHDVVPKLNDEVESFQHEVREGLQRNEFKPGLAHVILYFLIRHGIVTEENDPD
ncbi:related to thiamin pyrophosphokinase-related protein [Phialocephala subalpina]|uniref:Related to thiamin pyrophosphokinase-related protein n=1 Tax=Phialocephala subalpina TaxID=576137 RepID=A0A1L7XAF0_9HELO|nr:related to thiamin pyrophosphokinase-related protein [Phialocephala subalpina]